MANLLGDMDNIPAAPPVKTRKRKPEPQLDIPSRSTAKAPTRTGGYGYRNSSYADADTSSDGLMDTGFTLDSSSEDDFAATMLSPKKKLRTDTGAFAPTVEKLSRFHVDSSADEADIKIQSDVDSVFDGVDMNDFMDVDEDEFADVPSKSVLKVKKEQIDVRPRLSKLPATSSKEEAKKSMLDSTPAWLPVYDSLSVKAEESLGPQAGSSSRSANASNASVLEADGSFRFFWLDYLEHEGKLYFIGKTQDKTSKAWLSCCVTVENLERNLFVLPRDHRMEQDDETGELVETDVVPTLPDVYNDFDRVRKKLGIKAFKAKFVKRKYAFGEPDVPRGEAQWLKVVYGFDGTLRLFREEKRRLTVVPDPQIPNNVCSPNFARIFGTSTSAFELLVLKRKIMGPCWLQIKKPTMEHKGVGSIISVHIIFRAHLVEDILVQARSYGMRPEGYQPHRRGRSVCAKGYASADSYERERPNYRQPPGEQPRDSMCYSADMVKQ